MPLIFMLDFTPSFEKWANYRYSIFLKWLFYLHGYVDFLHGAIEIFLWILILKSNWLGWLHFHIFNLEIDYFQTILNIIFIFKYSIWLFVSTEKSLYGTN